MTEPILHLEDTDPERVDLLGGKAANLAALARMSGVNVPSGFVVPTTAYAAFIDANPDVSDLIGRLSVPGLGAPDVDSRRAELQEAILGARLPGSLAEAITTAAANKPGATWAVRSSGSLEDAPSTSFAGQHDSFLGLTGVEIPDALQRCWASLFTARAVEYRHQHGHGHRDAAMAVVVQELVDARVSGVLFTAHPLTSDRSVVVVEATVGLGEALVAGQAPADTYDIRDDTVTNTVVATKPTAVRPSPDGGTRTVPLDPTVTRSPALSEEEALALARLGRGIEAQLGSPQDIEWCIDSAGRPWVVQARSITTLFPVPESDSDDRRVYVSVGHNQMMTDPMTPLGLSVWQLTSPAPMRHAAGRLFVDVTDQIASPGRETLLAVMGRGDPRVRHALETVLDRGLVPTSDGDPPARPPGGQSVPDLDVDDTIVPDLIAENEASVAELRRSIEDVTGTGLVEFVRKDIQTLREQLFAPRSHAVVMSGMQAAWWLTDTLGDWLGHDNPVDELSQAAPHNITARMGLELLDVADAIRPHPAAVAVLRAVGADDDGYLDRLDAVDGGLEARAAIEDYLAAYGMRCVGEIDIGRPRWAERPQLLAPLIIANIDHHEPGEHQRRFDGGRAAAARRTAEIVERVRALPDGEAKARETESAIRRLRAFIGYREYPKYGMICRYFEYRKALLFEADRLVAAGLIDQRDDIFFLSLDELEAAIRDREVDRELIERRRAELESFRHLTPPRVLTSDGETLDGDYCRDDLPAGALSGLAVSSGVVEGRARVIHTMADAVLEPGDILVTTHTDPSWSPLFVNAAALVTEVGGLMTHGSVVAREYGLPAVVGVTNATSHIVDGQRIRVDGTNGHVSVVTTE